MPSFSTWKALLDNTPVWTSKIFGKLYFCPYNESVYHHNIGDIFYRYLYHVMEKISNHGMSRDVVLKVSNKDFLKIHFRPLKNKGALYQIKTWHYSGHSTWLIPTCLKIGTDLISRLSLMQSNLVYPIRRALYLCHSFMRIFYLRLRCTWDPCIHIILHVMQWRAMVF